MIAGVRIRETSGEIDPLSKAPSKRARSRVNKGLLYSKGSISFARGLTGVRDLRVVVPALMCSVGVIASPLAGRFLT